MVQLRYDRSAAMRHEEIELLKHGYLRHFVVILYCRDCGLIRVATTTAPSGEYCSCPVCGRPNCGAGLIGVAYSKREVPFSDVITPPA